MLVHTRWLHKYNSRPDTRARILRRTALENKIDPRQSLVGLLQLSSTLQKLGRFQDTLPLLLEAQQAAKTIACWQERNRYIAPAKALEPVECAVEALSGVVSVE